MCTNDHEWEHAGRLGPHPCGGGREAFAPHLSILPPPICRLPVPCAKHCLLSMLLATASSQRPEKRTTLWLRERAGEASAS
jgi:hypothetical protein